MNLKVNELFHDSSDRKKYTVVSQLGSGSFGIVYLVQEVKTKQKYALKIQKSITQQELQLLELQVKRRFTNLVNTISFGQHIGLYPYSIMEYCQENLYETIQKNGTITNELFRYVAHQIATGLKELHQLGLIHRDIKPENIMQFDHEDRITKQKQKTYKICDFGLVKKQDLAKTQFSGTPYYLAPEQLNAQEMNYSNKVDIWALGIVFYELVAGWPLFQARVQEQIYELIRNEQIDEKIEKLNLNHEYKILIKGMLNREPDKRPSIQEVLIKLSSAIQRLLPQPKFIQQMKDQQPQLDLQKNSVSQHLSTQLIDNNQQSQIQDQNPQNVQRVLHHQLKTEENEQNKRSPIKHFSPQPKFIKQIKDQPIQLNLSTNQVHQYGSNQLKVDQQQIEIQTQIERSQPVQNQQIQQINHKKTEKQTQNYNQKLIQIKRKQ